MNSRDLRRIITSHVSPAKFLALEESLKPPPRSKAFWDEKTAQRPLTIKGSPHITALMEILSDQLEEASGQRPKKTEVLNLLIAEGVQALSKNPEFAGLNPRPPLPDEDEIKKNLGFT